MSKRIAVWLALLFADGLGTNSIQTVATNVPGPTQSLYAAGRRMQQCFLYVPLVTAIRIGVAMISYDDQLTFAVTGDYDHAPDTDVLCAGIEEGIAELLAADAADGSVGAGVES